MWDVIKHRRYTRRRRCFLWSIDGNSSNCLNFFFSFKFLDHFLLSPCFPSPLHLSRSINAKLIYKVELSLNVKQIKVRHSGNGKPFKTLPPRVTLPGLRENSRGCFRWIQTSRRRICFKRMNASNQLEKKPYKFVRYFRFCLKYFF